MRHLSTKLILALGMLLPLFYGCGNDDDGPDLIPPTINSPDDIEVNARATATISYSVTTNGGYASAAAVSSTPATATVEVTSQPADGSADGTVVVTVTGVAAGQTTVTLTVTDDQNQNANDEVGVTVNAVDGPEPPTPGDTFNSPGDTIAAIADLSTLASALDTAGLVETLNDNEKKYTIFAPNNAAFTKLLATLGAADLDALVAELTTEGLAGVLGAHVIADSLPADLLEAKEYPTLTEGKTITVTKTDDGVFVNGAGVVTPNIFTSNGVIHIIDSVINAETTPPTETPSTVVDSIAARDELNSLEAALTTANLVEPLRGEGPFTVFAPNNDAFTALLAAQEVDNLEALVAKLGGGDATAGAAALAGILQAHVVSGKILAADLEAKDYATLAEGETLTIVKDDQGGVTVDGATVVTADIEADNGVVHIIDAVVNLTAPPVATPATVVDVIAGQESLTSLASAVTTAGLTEALQGTGPFTVFAPNNDAFAALLAAQEVQTLEALVEKLGDGDAEAGATVLADILQAHVISGRLTVADLQEQAYQTLTDGQTITITKDDEGNVLADGALVTPSDLASGNGVVHIINRVLNVSEPPAPGSTIVSLVTEREELSTLETVLNTEGVAVDGTTVLASLQGDGPFTLFAPNNAAFQTLIDEDPEVTDLNGLIAKLGVEKVARILRAHVVAGRYTFGMVEGAEVINDTDVYESLEGPTLTARIDGAGQRINGATVAEADIVVDNGIVHVLDGVVNASAGNTGENGFTVTITNVSRSQRYFQHAIFNTPVDATAPGPIANGQSYAFTFNAGPFIVPNDGGTKLSFVSMLMPSNDSFLGTNPEGISLYNANGQAISAGGPVKITDQVKIWDAGTKLDNGDPDVTVVALKGDGNAATLVDVEISNAGTEFTVRITNLSADNTFSPGVFGIHTEGTPIFATDRGAGGDGLREVAETGDPTKLNNTMSGDDEFAVPLSPGAYAIHSSGVSPILVPKQATPDNGLKALAEEGDPAALLTALGTTDGVKTSAQTGGIAPGESIAFDLDNVVAGDVLSWATMMVQSNDIVYSTSEVGIPLFDANGRPVSGNVTNRVFAYDAGTEANEYPGAGLNQPLRGPNSAPAEGTPEGTVERVTNNDRDPSADGFIYRPVNQRVRVIVTPK